MTGELKRSEFESDSKSEDPDLRLKSGPADSVGQGEDGLEQWLAVVKVEENAPTNVDGSCAGTALGNRGTGVTSWLWGSVIR